MATTVLGLKTFAASDPVDYNEVNDNYVKIDSAFKKVDAKIEDGKSAVKSELRAEIDVERKRIDNIASLPDGSTSGDAELSDIRIGADGKRYESAGAAVRGQISDIKDEIGNIVLTGKNLAQFGEWGYVLNNGAITEADAQYYATTKLVKVLAGETVTISTVHNTQVVRLRIVDAEAGNLLTYATALETVGDTRDYTVYTAAVDSEVQLSYIADRAYPQIEYGNTATEYEPYTRTLNDSIAIPGLETVITEMDALEVEKADVIRSANIFKPVNNGYVAIQNILVETESSAYVTSDWVHLQIGEKIIFSSARNFCRLYVGRNMLPTTEGGSRIAYVTEFSGAEDGRNYVAYTATQECYVRVSAYAYADSLPMVEKTNANVPSTYQEPGDELDPNLRVRLAEKANGLTEEAKADLSASYWYGKKVLVLGDSLTAAGVWQQKLNTALGMEVTTHAKGGIGFPAMLDGSSDSTDPETQASGSLAPLTADDVKDKDLIVIFGGYNHRGSADGAKGDLYPTVNSTYGCLQYLINGVYGKLAEAGNLKCRVAIVTPHCAGKYSYIPYDWNSEYPAGSGRTGETLINAIKDCAADNRLPCLDLFHNSGINEKTWNVFSSSDSPVDSSGNVRDQLHLNAQVGYPYLGDVIARWVNTQ